MYNVQSKEKVGLKRECNSMQILYSPHFQRMLKYSILFLVPILCYSNTFTHGYVLDDGDAYLRHRFVQKGFSGVFEIWTHSYWAGAPETLEQETGLQYRPIPLTCFALEKACWGNDPVGSHILHVFLYALTGVWLFIWLCHFFPQGSPRFWWWVTLLYLLHPVHTEVVANFKSRDELLTLFFLIASFDTLGRVLDKLDKLDKQRWLFGVSMLCFGACLFSKETGVTGLLLIPLILWYRCPSFSSFQILLWTIPYLFCTAFYLGIRTLVLGSLFLNRPLDLLHNSLVGAETTLELFATRFYLLACYLKLSFFPYPLSWDYSYPQIPLQNGYSLGAWFGVLSSLVLLYFAFTGVRKKTPWGWGLAFYGITLSLTCNFFIPIAWTFGERFLFLPTLGTTIGGAWFLLWLLRINPISFHQEKRGLVLFCGIALLSASVTFERNKVWESDWTLFHSGLETSPKSARVYFSVGWVLEKQVLKVPGQEKELLKQACIFYRKALELYPEYAYAWYRLGVCCSGLRQENEAEYAYIRTLELVPRHLEALNNLGSLYARQKRYEQARDCFQKVLDLQRQHTKARFNLASLLMLQHKYSEAIAHYEKVLEEGEVTQVTYQMLSKAYYESGNFAKAQEYWNKFLSAENQKKE
jgi:tetratricopeptide (TPR) repeat protein